ncbi:hypothetical protein ASE78_17965 [Sphingomonas sp. Leaf25]|nr:hypothetical protein ASE78_17965 [Sphingomonas sp. Leaf25]
MGSGMVRSLRKAGLPVTVWNRTAAKADALRASGASVAQTPEEAVAEADIVITMVFDTAAVEQVMARALPAMRPDAVWMQSATVGLAGVRELSAKVDRSIAYVDTPVLGSKDAAEGGTLIVVSAGNAAGKARLQPVFDAIGDRVIDCGTQPGEAQRLKMVVQSWAMSVTSATGQAVALASNLGIDPNGFLGAIKGGSQDCGYAHIKGEAIMKGQFDPAFTVEGAVKDTALVAQAMTESKTDPALMQALNAGYREVAASGRNKDDMAAVFFSFKD